MSESEFDPAVEKAYRVTPEFADSALFDAEFVSFDGLDEDDALARGFSLTEIAPPQAGNDEQLRERMVQPLGQRA